jgi:hypothetical protein
VLHISFEEEQVRVEAGFLKDIFQTRNVQHWLYGSKENCAKLAELQKRNVEHLLYYLKRNLQYLLHLKREMWSIY